MIGECLLKTQSKCWVEGSGTTPKGGAVRARHGKREGKGLQIEGHLKTNDVLFDD